MTEKISVVVPAYNAEDTIERCLNSILSQTYNNLEVLVINDGSTDRTKALFERIRDPRIILHNVKNGGVSRARNIGIDNATGDYITFVDSDDYIDPDMYSTLIDLIHKYGVEIAHCSYKNVKSNGELISAVGDEGKIVPQNHEEAIVCLLEGRLFVGGLWNKLYKARLFEEIRLDESIKFNEDILMNYLLFEKVEKSVFCDRAFYNYVACESSATHSADQVKATNQMLYVARKIHELSKGKAYERVAESKVARCLLEVYRAYLFAEKDLKQQEIAGVLSEIIRFKEKGFYQSKRDKTIVFLYRHFPKMFVFLYKHYDKIRVKKLDPD